MKVCCWIFPIYFSSFTLCVMCHDSHLLAVVVGWYKYLAFVGQDILSHKWETKVLQYSIFELLGYILEVRLTTREPSCTCPKLLPSDLVPAGVNISIPRTEL